MLTEPLPGTHESLLLNGLWAGMTPPEPPGLTAPVTEHLYPAGRSEFSFLYELIPDGLAASNVAITAPTNGQGLLYDKIGRAHV